jgi:hypothetical protein
MFQTLPQKYIDRIEMEPNSGCWLWAGYVNTEGYAKFGIRGRPTISVHRFIYELFFQPAKELHHICKTRCCVNPNHLQPVTRSEHRMLSPSRMRNVSHCINGHPFSEENTMFIVDAHHPHGMRQCRTCARLRTKIWRQYHNRNK